jgi:predicted nucleotide-binding protein
VSVPRKIQEQQRRARIEGTRRWALENLELLELIWAKRDADGEWPKAKLLQRELFAAGRDLRVDEVARAMPPQLGRLDVMSGRLLLTPRGLSFVVAARPLLVTFPDLIAIAVVRYADPGIEPQIWSHEFQGLLSIDARQAHELTDILSLDSWLFRPAGNGPDGDQVFQVDDSAIFEVRNVRSVEDYFEAQERAWYGAPRGTEIPSESWVDTDSPPGGLDNGVIDEPVDLLLADGAKKGRTMTNANRSVFVVHGRNQGMRKSMFEFLRSIDLAPIEWAQAIELTGQGSPYIGEVLDTAFEHAQVIVVLMTPDEVAYLQPRYGNYEDDPETRPAAQARPNVLFEAGMALGRDPARTVLVEVGEIRPFSDVAGRHAVRLCNAVSSRQELANRLRTAGCPVNVAGTDWHAAGDFTAPTPPGDGLPLGRRVPSNNLPRPALDFGLSYSIRGANKFSKLKVINRGSETAYDVNLAVPEGAGLDLPMARNGPIKKIPGGGKSVTLDVFSPGHFGANRDDAFDVTITARTEGGQSVSQDVFLDLNG